MSTITPLKADDKVRHDKYGNGFVVSTHELPDFVYVRFYDKFHDEPQIQRLPPEELQKMLLVRQDVYFLLQEFYCLETGRELGTPEERETKMEQVTAKLESILDTMTK